MLILWYFLLFPYFHAYSFIFIQNCPLDFQTLPALGHSYPLILLLAFFYAYSLHRCSICPFMTFAFALVMYTINVTLRNIFIFPSPLMLWRSNS